VANFASTRLWLLVPLFVCASAARAKGEPAPSGDKAPGIQVTVDVSEAPELENWGAKSRALCLVWHDRIRTVLGRSNPPKHREIELVFKKDMPGVADTSGGVIRISASYVQQHPDDFGMVVHELCHVVQAYPPSRAGWLVEGIADNVRYWHYEPGAREFPIDRSKSSYKQAYGTAARFLAWLQAAKNVRIIQELDSSLATGQYRDELFHELAGADLDDLWAEFVTSAAIKGKDRSE
jgi:hypothetical protein